MTSKEAAKIIGVSRGRVSQLVKEGKIEPLNRVKKGGEKIGKFEFDEAEIRRYTVSRGKPESIQERVNGRLREGIPPRRNKGTENRLDRIESKLDEILTILEG